MPLQQSLPDQLENVLLSMVSAIKLIRGQALNHCLFKVFCNEVGLNTVFFITQKQGHNEVRWRPGKEAGLERPYSNLRSFFKVINVTY